MELSACVLERLADTSYNETLLSYVIPSFREIAAAFDKRNFIYL